MVINWHCFWPGILSSVAIPDYLCRLSGSLSLGSIRAGPRIYPGVYQRVRTQSSALRAPRSDINNAFGVHEHKSTGSYFDLISSNLIQALKRVLF